VSLPGHSPGHCGVALETTSGWMLHAGDAYYDHRELEKKSMPIGLSLFQKVVHFDYSTAMKTQARLRDLENVRVFCAHDPKELTILGSGAGN
jgi:glyoxylase-like metal-dependent hydrolase (beta-lactamase superfamily II)